VILLGFEITLPVVLLGLVTGLTYGILAVGLVLIHRSNRIINFAHGEIGVFGAAVLGVAVNEGGVPYWIAFPGALAISAGIGALAEVLVIRRLRHAPAIMSVVATLGLALLLLLLSLVVNANLTAGRLFPQPTGLPSFDVGPLFVSSAYSGMLLITPVLVLGLTVFLRRSRYGLAIRAAAANSDAARLSGVFTTRMSTLSWAIAGAVAAVTAILVLPTRGFISTEFLGPGLLLRALAAAVLARMVSLPVALAAGVAVGMVEQLLLWNDPRGGLVEMVLFVVVLVALLLQPKQGGRAEDKGSWALVQPWPPLPDAWRGVWTVRHGGALLAGIALLALLALPLAVSNAAAITLIAIMAFTLVGLSIGIVTGLCGQLSLGQFALAGVGAFASYLITLGTGSYVLGFLGAGLAAAAVSLVIGLPALRIRGLMLAVTTLGFALAAQSWLFAQPWVFGDGVDPGRPIVGDFVFDTGRRYYYVALAVLCAGFALARNVWSSGLGRRLRAVRDNEDGARAFTVPATLVKLQGFVLAGFLAGLGGAAYGHALSRIGPATFPVDANIDAVAVAVLGGVGVLAGPALGALYIIGVPEFLPLDNAGLAATSLGWLLLVLSYPGGFAQALRPVRERVLRALVRLGGQDPDGLLEAAAASPAPRKPST
jgi:ABC-type branched-subunit amino acid transport system permease subunit